MKGEREGRREIWEERGRERLGYYRKRKGFTREIQETL